MINRRQGFRITLPEIVESPTEGITANHCKERRQAMAPTKKARPLQHLRLRLQTSISTLSRDVSCVAIQFFQFGHYGRASALFVSLLARTASMNPLAVTCARSGWTRGAGTRSTNSGPGGTFPAAVRDT